MTDKQRIQMHQHSKNMALQLNRQRLENTDYCDVIIKVEDVHFSAHRSVLAACSPFFDAMFTSKMVEQFKKEVEIKDVKKHIFNDVINFIYTDQIIFSAENVRDVLHCSSFLQIKDLLDATVEYLTRTICPENWFIIRGLGQLYTLPTLVLEAEKCMLHNFDDSSLHESFLELTATDLDSIMKSEDLVVSSEFVLLQALISWVEKDVKNRQQPFLTLLKYVRFQFIPIEYLTKTFRKMASSLSTKNLTLNTE
ncbi:kelch-like protein 3 [Ciona intestinalis]